MPREPVDIVLDSPCPFEGAALFFAVIAYPTPGEETEGREFWTALCREAVLIRARADKNYRRGRASVGRPIYFAADEKAHIGALKAGSRRLDQRMQVTHRIVMPHLKAIETGALEKILDEDPTVMNMAQLIARERRPRKEGGDSAATVQSRYWAPTKPVAHAVAGYLSVAAELSIEHHSPRNVAPAEGMAIEAFLWAPAWMARILERAETFRALLPTVEQFRISRDETIPFAASSMATCQKEISGDNF